MGKFFAEIAGMVLQEFFLQGFVFATVVVVGLYIVFWRMKP